MNCPGWAIAVWLLSAGVLAVLGAAALVQICWARLQRWAERRLARRVRAQCADLRARFYRKVLRHAPTGQVGLCIEAGFVKHRWLGWLRVVETVDLIVCAGCARRELEPAHPLVLILSMPHPGQRIRVPMRETAAALDSEIAAFRAAMDQCNPEGRDDGR